MPKRSVLKSESFWPLQNLPSATTKQARAPALLKKLDGILDKQEYLVQNTFSVADVAVTTTNAPHAALACLFSEVMWVHLHLRAEACSRAPVVVVNDDSRAYRLIMQLQVSARQTGPEDWRTYLLPPWAAGCLLLVVHPSLPSPVRRVSLSKCECSHGKCYASALYGQGVEECASACAPQLCF
jgi:hypothetical protein